MRLALKMPSTKMMRMYGRNAAGWRVLMLIYMGSVQLSVIMTRITYT